MIFDLLITNLSDSMLLVSPENDDVDVDDSDISLHSRSKVNKRESIKRILFRLRNFFSHSSSLIDFVFFESFFS